MWVYTYEFSGSVSREKDAAVSGGEAVVDTCGGSGSLDKDSVIYPIAVAASVRVESSVDCRGGLTLQNWNGGHGLYAERSGNKKDKGGGELHFGYWQSNWEWEVSSGECNRGSWIV